MSLFGSSGIRGLAGAEVGPELLMAVGRAVGSQHDRCIVARDPRTTGPMLLEALVAGLVASGADAHDAGMVSTPTLALAARHFDAGAIVTASHNPPEYNGVKLWSPNGMGFNEAQRREVETLVTSGGFRNPGWKDVGGRHPHPGAEEEHVDAILRAVVPKGKVRVVVDCGCGATCHITPRVLVALGCDVMTLNAQPDGSFPGRPPEPTEENLGLLRATVVSSGAHLGIAHDGDGDRMVAVDEKGGYVAGDRLLTLFARREGRHRIVVPLDASMALEEHLSGVEVVRTKVGDVYVAEEVASRHADFGGEPSGTWIFPNHSLCPDGVYAAARLVSLVGEGRLSELLREVPSYPLRRSSFPFPSGARPPLVQALEKHLRTLSPRSISKLDGWRLEFEGGWALVRLSGTEAKVRVTVEARKEADVEDLFRRVTKVVEEVLH